LACRAFCGDIWEHEFMSRRSGAGQPPAVAPAPSATFDAEGWAATARARFVLPTSERVTQVKSELLEARDRLAGELTQFPDGMAIAKELELGSYEELAEKPSLDRLDKIILATRLARDKRVQPTIDTMRRSLRDFRATVLLAADNAAAMKFTKAVDLLAASMKGGAADPMPNYRELTDAYAYLSETRLVQDLLPPIRQRFSHFNQRLLFRQKLLDRVAQEEIKQTRDINENQDGMQINGVSHIVARPNTTLMPSESRASVAVHLDAVVNSDITGYKHPATVFAHSVVNLTIDVPVYLSDIGVDAPEPLICAVANSQLTGMCLHLKRNVFNRLLMPLAQKLAQKKLTESDPEVAEKARGEIAKMVEENRGKMIVQVNDLIQRLLWQSFEARDIAANVRFRTTSSELSWTAEYVGPGDLGSPNPAPELPAEAELGVQFHESTFNNTDVAVAGNKINEAIYREMLYDTFKFAPEDEDENPSAPRIPATLTFADTQPLRMTFDDGKLSAVLRLKEFSLNGQRYDDKLRVVRVAYKPVMSANGFSLDRDGDIEILDDGGANRVEFEIALRRFFKPQFRSSTIQDPSKKISLRVGGLTIEDGWISAFVVGVP
jgi:hypothetical protein